MNRWLSIIVVILLAWPLGFASAQEPAPTPTPAGPVYVVQEGDNLWGIAQRFGVDPDTLAQANGLTDPGKLSVGQELLIPGLMGLSGRLVTVDVPLGETLTSLSRRYQLTTAMLASLNHFTGPQSLYAGSNLVLPESSATQQPVLRAMLAPGQSLLELAILSNASPWKLMHTNQISHTWAALPGDVLDLPTAGQAGPGALPPAVSAIALKPAVLAQGKANVIEIDAGEAISLTGSLLGHPLNFFPAGPGVYQALQGVHAMTAPGVYPLTLSGSLARGEVFSFTQYVLVTAVDYPYDQPLAVDPATIDPAITKPEDAIWNALTVAATPERLWHEKFTMPGPLSEDYCLETGECWTSRYGNRRSYNGSEYLYFHTGLDIAGGTGVEIYAPAAGVVVFAGPLTVRGNATMINHGWGVYTGYMHQSEINVKVGDRVEAGQLIGLVGGTGRVQGPHLHWEVWVGGVQVDPLDWLEQEFP